MEDKEEKAKKFADKQQELARSGANAIKDNLKKSGIELNDEQFKTIEGIISMSMTVAMLHLMFSK